MTVNQRSAGLEQHVRDWRPESVTTADALDAHRAAELAATLDLPEAPQPGEALPPLWHWMYFTDWPPTADLGADGHPRGGHFLPPIPDRRRMFAGGRVTVHESLVLGQPATRTAELVSSTVKQGKTGELLFVTVRYEVSQADRPRVSEEQDLVYRSDTGTQTTFERVTEPLGPQRTPWAFEPATHPALLFRFSALTANAHRIHYDERYTTHVEGFPGLVVHGPLLALYMAELTRASTPRSLRTFEFRLRRPVFAGDAIRVQGAPTANPDAAELAVVSGADTTHATARALLA